MPVEHATFWRSSDVDLLRATFVTHSFVPHTHEEYAIGVVTRGVESFRYRGATHHAFADSIVMVNPGEVHTGHAATPQGWTYHMYYPNVALLERASSELGRTVTPFFPRAVVQDAVLARRMLVTHAALEHAASQLERDALMLGTWCALIERHAETQGTSKPPLEDAWAVRLVRDHLHAHFAQNTSLEALSQLSGLSGFHLTRSFKRAYGLPPHALQTQLRVRDARRRILAGSSLATAALEAGFSDQAHLTRVFKRVYGVTPGVYARSATLEI
jgi:AraC-like DNA-binding protein